MLMAPNDRNRHSRLNLMPAFRPKEGPAATVPLLEFQGRLDEENKKAVVPTEIVELSDIDRELLIRWLTGDHRVVFGGQPIAGVK